jgi:hypothetical protein
MNFFANYMKYCEGCETPEIYDLWSSLATMSSIVSRRVWVNQGYFRIYPNLYVVLVGPPGGRKTTAMNVCKDMLTELKTINFAATCMTKEAMCKYMVQSCIKTFTIPDSGQIKEYTPITMCLTELSHFLGANSAHMIDFLTTIYDQEFYDAKTKNKGDDIIPAPYLTILACTTPSNITRYLKEDVISGGFSRRTLFAYETDDGEPIPYPEVTPEAQAAWDSCVAYARSLEGICGEFTWDPKAKDWYGKWYCDFHNSLKNHHEQLTRGYLKSKHVQLLKISMLVALAEEHVLVLKRDHLEIALDMLNRLEKNLHKVYEGMGRNELNAISARLIELLETAKRPLPEKEVVGMLYRDADTAEIYSLLNHLHSVGRIVRLEQRAKDGSFTRKVVTTPEIADREFPGWRASLPPPT